MALVQNPITGVQKGGFSTAIFQYYFGKNIMRSKPLVYHDAKTPSQLIERSFFSDLNKIGSNFKYVIYNSLKSFENNKSGWARFIGLNSSKYTLDVNNNKILNLDELVFSVGSAVIPTINNVSIYDSANIKISLDDFGQFESLNNGFLLSTLIYCKSTRQYTFSYNVPIFGVSNYLFGINNINPYAISNIWLFISDSNFQLSSPFKFSNNSNFNPSF